MATNPTKVLGVRFTATERAAVESAAEVDGQSLAAWVRHLAVEVAGGIVEPDMGPRTAVGVRLDDDTIAWLDGYASARGLTRSDAFRHVLDRVRAGTPAPPTPST